VRAAGSFRERSQGLSSTSETLFVAGSLDDFVAIAEAEVGSKQPLLVPETLDAVLELLDLSGDFGIVAVRKHVPKLGAALGRALDLGLDLRKCLHVS
jgi:hypothetical protein